MGTGRLDTQGTSVVSVSLRSSNNQQKEEYNLIESCKKKSVHCCHITDGAGIWKWERKEVSGSLTTPQYSRSIKSVSTDGSM